MLMLVFGIAVFFAVHSVSIVAPAWRDASAARMGPLAWKAVYGLLSLVGLVLMVKGYTAARLEPSVLYLPPAWLRHVTLLLMVPVFPLLLAAYLPGRIKTLARHPMLLAVKLWALAHLLANGMLADVLLFGAFLLWAVADRISLKRRTPRPVPGLPLSAFNDGLVIVGGLLLYAAFAVWLHPLLIGVAVVG